MNALLIGLGNIGLKYDLHSHKEIYRTHSKSLKKINYFKQISVVDIKKQNLKLAKLNYNFKIFEKIKDAIHFSKPEFVIISTNTNMHLKNLTELIKLHIPKVILMEKPLSNNLKNVEKIISICEKNKIELFTNFIRRSEKSTIDIKKYFLKGKYYGRVYYNKGFLNNGSHWINLLEYFFGQVQNFSIIKSIKTKSDKNITVKLIFKKHQVELINNLNKKNSNYMILDSNYNQINYLEGGKKIYLLDKIKKKKIIIKNHMKKYQLKVLNEIVKFIKKKSAFELCDKHESLNNFETIFKIYSKK